jgi:hypothetical protein
MKPAIFRKASIAALGLAVLSGAAGAQPQTAAASLQAFEGRWACAGSFAASGKPIASTITAAWDAPTQALVLHQDDVPPNRFHALELWGAFGATGFRVAIADNFGGVRWLDSPGWVDDRLTLTRMAGAQPAERFVFSRPRDAAFSIEWSPAAKTGGFGLGDSLTCRQARP